jgi:hypothetical protein
MNRRDFACTLALALMALAGGCKKKIGDPCLRSTDCSFRGDRLCDLSHRVNAQGVQTRSGKGECTIQGCGRGTCPKEAACVKVYGTDFLTVPCDPLQEDLAIACASESADACLNAGCVARADGDGYVCPPRDDCRSNEVCLPEGLCADEITARTSCRRECKDNGDCRTGYSCRRTGSNGVYQAPDLDDPENRDQVKICMPVQIDVDGEEPDAGSGSGPDFDG